MAAIYRFVLRSLWTRGRIAIVGTVGAVCVGLGAIVGAEDPSAIDGLVRGLGLSIFVPIAALTYGSAALGDPVEDQTIVYMWLRPVARWKIATGAMGAVLTVTLPLVLVPMGAMTALGRADAPTVVGAVGASALAAMGYGGVFCGLGIMIKRALAWGLIYVVIWEGVVANVGAGPARGAISLYVRSAFARLADLPPPEPEVAAATAVVVPLVVAGVALVLTTLRLIRMDVA